MRAVGVRTDFGDDEVMVAVIVDQAELRSPPQLLDFLAAPDALHAASATSPSSRICRATRDGAGAQERVAAAGDDAGVGSLGIQRLRLTWKRASRRRCTLQGGPKNQPPGADRHRPSARPTRTAPTVRMPAPDLSAIRCQDEHRGYALFARRRCQRDSDSPADNRRIITPGRARWGGGGGGGGPTSTTVTSGAVESRPRRSKSTRTPPLGSARRAQWVDASSAGR